MQHQRGFTLVEVIVVVAILTILASIIGYNVSQARTRAEAKTLLEQLGTLETAFRAYRQFELADTGWPELNETNNNSDISVIVAGGSSQFPGFDDYFTANLNLEHGFDYNYTYDSGVGAYRCSGSDYHESGVNLRIGPSGNQAKLNALFEIMNEMLDDDDPTEGVGCGKIRIGGTADAVYYKISDSGTSR